MSERGEWVWVICPYCGVRQKAWLERGGPQVVLCDCEDFPGCDRYFAVTVTMKPILEYFALNETVEHEDCTDERMKEALADDECMW